MPFEGAQKYKTFANRYHPHGALPDFIKRTPMPISVTIYSEQEKSLERRKGHSLAPFFCTSFHLKDCCKHFQT